MTDLALVLCISMVVNSPSVYLKPELSHQTDCGVGDPSDEPNENDRDAKTGGSDLE